MAGSSRGGSSLAPGQIYSQPALTGAGIHNSTVLVTALDSLKAQRNPVRLEDFALTYGLTALIEDESLRQRFKNHPRVEWNAKLDLWSYKPEHDVRSPRDLVALLKSRYESNTSKCAGMKLSELRESYPQAKEAIEEFAARKPAHEREVLVMRGKDGAIKMAFWNAVQGEDAAGPDAEFRDFWAQTKVPDAVDLARQLEAEGMSSANLIQSTVTNSQSGNLRGGKRGGRGGKRGGGSGRRGKVQNTHLVGIDLSKDYA